ncbi:CHAP domain-containing protein [Flindersiella endophytica]
MTLSDRVRSAPAAAAVAALLLVSMLLVPAAAHAGPAPVHDAARLIAYQQLRDTSRNVEIPLGSNCNYYAKYWGTGSGCANGWRSEAWCADFAKYVWRYAGANVSGLNASTESFRNYGLAHGTWHPTLAGIRPGDVAVFDDDNDPSSTYHLGVVAEVGASGVSIISGNVSNRITQHDINWGSFNGDFIGYVAPVAA